MPALCRPSIVRKQIELFVLLTRPVFDQVKKEDSSSSESSEETSDEEESDFTKSLRQKFGLQKGEPIPSPSARLLQKAKSPSVGMATNAILFS